MRESSTGSSLRSLLPRIVEFLGYLRSRGVAIGIQAEIDLGRALGSVPVLDREGVRDALRTTIAKSPEDLVILDRAFEEFWDNAEGVPVQWSVSDDLKLPPRRSPDRARRAARPARPAAPPRTVSVPVGTWSATAPASGHPIDPLPDRDRRAYRRGARRFRREVATLPGRRGEPSRRGDIDLRDTIRQGLRHSGELTELRRRAPPLHRAELVVLWDVSGSMREHESRLFALVHALETTSLRARVFAFSTRISEITEPIRRDGYHRAAESVGRRLERTDGGTQIAASLRALRERFGGALNDRTTLVVVSDGWDLGAADQVGPELAGLRRRVRAIVWVNPYARTRGFEPRVAALRSALPMIDRLLGPEDFVATRPLRPIPLAA